MPAAPMPTTAMSAALAAARASAMAPSWTIMVSASAELNSAGACR
jgi:hypothetical protein